MKNGQYTHPHDTVNNPHMVCQTLGTCPIKSRNCSQVNQLGTLWFLLNMPPFASQRNSLKLFQINQRLLDTNIIQFTTLNLYYAQFSCNVICIGKLLCTIHLILPVSVTQSILQKKKKRKSRPSASDILITQIKGKSFVNPE